jgi:hypothetical protein
VWLKGTNLYTLHPIYKLRPKWFGLFEVIEVLSLVTYYLALPLSWWLYNMFYASLLSPYYKTMEYGIGYSKLTPNLINREPKWEVEAILALRCFGRQHQL